jgi:RNA polymerase sigma-70 factor (ECF subfamily)
LSQEDKEILEKFGKEESRNQAFNLLIRKYQKRVYWLIRKMVIDHDDANDLSQEVFVKIWYNLDAFRGDSALFTWIYRVATNECLAFLKKKRRRFFLPIHDLEGELAGKVETGHHFSGNEIEKKLQLAILKLPEKQRLVFNMKYFEEMTYEEMSDVLGTSVGALKASYHHAVQKIKSSVLIEDENEDDERIYSAG